MQGVDHVIYVTALERTLLFRQYAIKLKRSGTKVSLTRHIRISDSMQGPFQYVLSI